MRNVLKVMPALLKAAAYFCVRLKRECLVRARYGLPAIWFVMTTKPDASQELRRLRLKSCADCYVFSGQHKTCGWAGGPKWDPDGSGHENMGCFCQMEVKVQYKNSTCWLNDVTDGRLGWPEEARKNGAEYGERR